jgi:hypothetical protein
MGAFRPEEFCRELAMSTSLVLTWENLNEALFDAFPLLKNEEFSRLIGGLEGWEPGQYVVFGSLFNAYLRKSKDSLSDRSKVAEFLERMATSNNENIEDLLKIEVLPTLIESQTMIDAYWPQLGPRTQWFVDLIAPSKAPNIILRR